MIKVNKIQLLFKAIIGVSVLILIGIGIKTFYSYHTAAHNPTHNPNALYKQAEEIGYGYKTANLLELSDITKNITSNDIRITIPEFIGITSKEIEAYLASQGIAISKFWQQLQKTYFATKKQKSSILAAKKFPAPLLNELKKLQDQLLDSCKNNIDIEHALPNVYHFMQNCQTSQWKLMVRSTGKEDTDTLANAGGNHTEANVPPQDKALIYAIHKVIASYFSEKSLNQRLQAGDQTIFAMPLIPVLVQRMIGETHNVIPTGIVAYSQETEGRTPGVTTIQCSFGHNEGVVESLVPVDTYYVSDSGSTYKIIKNKYQRLAPKKNHELSFVENPLSLQQQQALPDNAIKAVDQLLRIIQKHYHKPMDLELVFYPATNTIYLVQARPIVYARKKNQPNYLMNIKNCDVLACTTVCSGANDVQCITHKKELIIADTLNQALAAYNTMGEEKNLVKGIIVQRDAQPTSHAAAVFRGEGKLVMQTENLNTLSSWLKNTKLHFYLDPQRQSIIRPNNQQSLEVASGWLNHPLPLQLSIDPQAPQACINDLYDAYPHYSFKKLLHLIISQNKTVATKALSSLLSKISSQQEAINNAINTYQQEGNLYLAHMAQVTKEQLQIILNNINTYLPSLTESLSLATNDMRRLFHSRFLQALIMQKQSPTLINNFSLVDILEEYSNNTAFYAETINPLVAKKVIAKEFLKYANLVSLAYQGCKVAFNPLVTKKWLTFLDKLRIHGTPQQHELLVNMIQHLTNTDLFTCWLNSTFSDTYTQLKNKPVKTRTLLCYNSLYEEYEEAQELLATFAQHKQYFSNITQALWEQPQSVEAQLQQFNTHILAFFNSEEFTRTLKQARRHYNLLQQACLSTMLLTTIERFDSLIKTIKGSTLYHAIETKNIHFKNALFLYLNLLKKFTLSQPLLTTLERALHNCQISEAKQLLNSSTFAVSDVIFFETTYEHEQQRVRQQDADRLVATLEDIFTSIHQLLLLKISKFVLEEWQLDELFVKPTILKQAEKILSLQKHLTGIRFDKDSITYLYNKQLRAHSVGIELCYSTTTQALSITTTFYGHNEYARWNIIKDYITTASQLKHLALTTVNQHKTGLSYSWNVSHTSSLDTIHTCLDNSITTTFKLGIENEKKMYFKNAKVLDMLHNHLSTLAGSREQLISFLSHNQPNDQHNIFNIPSLAFCAIENPEHTAIIKNAYSYASTHLSSKKLYELPLSLYAYKQLERFCPTQHPKDNKELNTLVQQVRRTKKHR